MADKKSKSQKSKKVVFTSKEVNYITSNYKKELAAANELVAKYRSESEKLGNTNVMFSEKIQQMEIDLKRDHDNYKNTRLNITG